MILRTSGKQVQQNQQQQLRLQREQEARDIIELIFILSEDDDGQHRNHLLE